MRDTELFKQFKEMGGKIGKLEEQLRDLTKDFITEQLKHDALVRVLMKKLRVEGGSMIPFLQQREVDAEFIYVQEEFQRKVDETRAEALKELKHNQESPS